MIEVTLELSELVVMSQNIQGFIYSIKNGNWSYSYQNLIEYNNNGLELNDEGEKEPIDIELT